MCFVPIIRNESFEELKKKVELFKVTLTCPEKEWKKILHVYGWSYQKKDQPVCSGIRNRLFGDDHLSNTWCNGSRPWNLHTQHFITYPCLWQTWISKRIRRSISLQNSLHSCRPKLGQRSTTILPMRTSKWPKKRKLWKAKLKEEKERWSSTWSICCRQA